MSRPMQPPEELHQWDDIVREKATEFQLDPFVILAQIWVECEEDVSRTDWTRHEPGYQYFWSPSRGALYDRRLSVRQNREKAKKILDEEVDEGEFEAQCTSFGLMQIMLAVARERGYEGPPEGLFSPETNIHFGCLYHAVCLKRARGDQFEALRKYNGAAVYAQEVLRRADILKNM